MTGKHSSVQRRQTLKAYGFMTPALIIIILFTIIPIIGSLVLMFYDYSVLGQTKFVGLKNFVKAFHDRVFWISIKNSVIFVVVVPIIQILSILLAVLVNKKLPGIGIFRMRKEKIIDRTLREINCRFRSSSEEVFLLSY